MAKNRSVFLFFFSPRNKWSKLFHRTYNRVSWARHEFFPHRWLRSPSPEHRSRSATPLAPSSGEGRNFREEKNRNLCGLSRETYPTWEKGKSSTQKCRPGEFPICFLEGMFSLSLHTWDTIYIQYIYIYIYTGLFAEETGFRGDVAFRRHL